MRGLLSTDRRPSLSNYWHKTMNDGELLNLKENCIAPERHPCVVV